jgi:hypothetical protein
VSRAGDFWGAEEEKTLWMRWTLWLEIGLMVGEIATKIEK